jgi:hypothetical protein
MDGWLGVKYVLKDCLAQSEKVGNMTKNDDPKPLHNTAPLLLLTRGGFHKAI